LASGSPSPPLPAIDATNVSDAFAGQHVRFVGIAHAEGEATTLVRFAITCCRADAAPVGLRLDRRLPVAEGSWVQADGRLFVGTRGLTLRVRQAHTVPAPADPFVYR
jgi:uncharacterized membrane protein YcgQ (UPF0703/DUF1980 family)